MVEQFEATEKRKPLDASMQKRSVLEMAKEIGINLRLISPPKILERLEILHAGSQTLEDEMRCIEFAKRLFAHYDENMQHEAFSTNEQRTVFLGTFFSDIGKTGPFDASPELSSFMVQIYEIDDIYDRDNVDLESFLDKFSDRLFSQKNSAGVEQRTRLTTLLFGIPNVRPDMTMREFYNLHARWTFDILKHAQGIPHGAIVAAAMHHKLEGVDPIEENAGAEIFRPHGELGVRGAIELNREQVAVILLDKYDASISRNQGDHIQAIDYLWDYVQKIPRFKSNKIFKELIASMELAFA